MATLKRQYEAPNFMGRDQRTATSSGVARGDTRAAPLRAGDDAWQSRLLAGLAEQGAGTMNKLADVEFSNQYLEGAAKAGIIQSEEELQGDPLTRDWQVAGYRDTMGKLALADHEAQFMVDLPALRQKGPEEMQTYLNERRRDIMPGLNSMSREARATAAGQMLLQDRAATKQYTTERKKFIIEERMQAESTGWNTVMQSLGNSQRQAMMGNAPEDFNVQLQNAAGQATSTWFDSSLPLEVKQAITFNKLNASLDNDSVALYEFMDQTQVPDAQGNLSTLVSRLPFEQQAKLANTYREARARTSDARNMYRTAQISNVKAQLDTGTYAGTYDELDGLLMPQVINKSITGEARGAMLEKFLQTSYKNQQNSQLGDMIQRGDINGVLNSGKSITEGIDALDANMAHRKVDPATRLETWMNVGLSGVDQGFKKSGEMLGVTMRQIALSKDDTVLPQHKAMFTSINATIHRAEQQGQTNTRSSILSGMGEGERMFAEQVLRMTADGASVDDSIHAARAEAAKDEGLSPAARAARATASTTAVNKAIQEIQPLGLWGTAWNNVKSIVSNEAASDLKLRPRSNMNTKDGWFTDAGTVQFYTEASREAVRGEVDNLAITRPSATPESLMTVAKANVAARTIMTQQGPVTMPRNANLEQVFGVSSGNQAAIGTAIDGLLKPQATNSRWRMTFAQGRLFAQEFDKDGQRVGNGRFIEGEVKAQIQKDTNAQQDMARYQFGTGKKVRVGDVSVQYNGSNTAGVPADWMFGLRSHLVDHEGVKDTVYNDLSGNTDAKGKRITTTGVGVSSTNEFYPKAGPDGKVSEADINLSFLRASDAAARTGSSMQKRIGLEDSRPAFQLLSELAYQSGPAFLDRKDNTGERYRQFVGALKSQDVSKAQEAFKLTAAWYYSRDTKDKEKVTKRQQSYLNLIAQTVKGT